LSPSVRPAAGRFFEDFQPGDRYRHARGTTIGESENQLLTKLVLNTAQAHFNEDAMKGTPFGRRIVFGLLTASIIIGLTMEDTAENALAELTLDRVRFKHPVFPGDTLYAYTEVLARDDGERSDAGIVRFKHWGLNQDNTVVCEAERSVLIKRRPAAAH